MIYCDVGPEFLLFQFSLLNQHLFIMNNNVENLGIEKKLMIYLGMTIFQAGILNGA